MQNFRRVHLSFPLQLALVSFLFNFSIESSRVFMPLYADEMGASKLDLGLIAAAYGMAYFVSSFIFGRLSDMRGRMIFIRWGLALSAAAYVFQIFAPNPMILLAIRGVIGFCLGIASAAMIAYVYEAGGRVGSFASYGSLGFLFGSLAAVATSNYEALFLASAVAAAIAFVISLTLREERISRIRVAVIPVGVMWTNRKIYLPFILRHMGATAIWAIFPIYLAGIGASKPMIAVINGINMGGQFVFMQLIQRFNPARLFTIGLVISIFVFAIYGIANNYLQLIPVQVLLALAWSLLFIGALNYLLARNIERGTASGMLYSSMYLAGGIGPFIGGGVSQVWGFSTLMFVSMGLSFVSLLASLGLGKKRETLRQ
jgi:MFS family permease